MIRKVFYANAGASDLIGFHRAWRQGQHYPGEVSITPPSLIEDFCRDLGARAYMTSVHPEAGLLEDDEFIIEHRPKRVRKGLAYHVEELRYGLSLLRTARCFGADLAILDSGSTHYFWMKLFPLFGIPVIPVLHNTLWPRGFQPTSTVQRLLMKLNALFWKRTPLAAIAASPEAVRQVDQLVPGHKTRIIQFRPQFPSGYFADLPAPPPHSQRPFQVMFVGRVHHEKGVLDIPLMAQRVEQKKPGLVKWVICGSGPQLEALRHKVSEMNLGHVIDVRGWVSLEEMGEVWTNSHASIVPTRSSFCEGFAMTTAECILAGRVLVSNPVVPGLEVLQSAALTARTDDPDSHADAVLRLAEDKDLYETLRANTSALQSQFYDRSLSMQSVLHDAVREAP